MIVSQTNAQIMIILLLCSIAVARILTDKSGLLFNRVPFKLYQLLGIAGILSLLSTATSILNIVVTFSVLLISCLITIALFYQSSIKSVLIWSGTLIVAGNLLSIINVEHLATTITTTGLILFVVALTKSILYEKTI